MLYIVGLGPGAREYILPKAINVLEDSEIIIGFHRAIDTIKELEGLEKKKFIKVNNLKEILLLLENNKSKKISLIASGDPCFYSLLNYIKANFNGEVELIPGISSFQYLSAKLLVSWSGNFVGSLHGREGEFIEIVKKEKISFWLTDKKNNSNNLAKSLLENKINCNLTVGANLSYDDEIIITEKPEKFLDKTFSDLVVIMVENKEWSLSNEMDKR
ncbi:MAG: precorrin-6y C5,15-methyltransferase (decarboxylating) subunit CbiE [Sarcina sp.]